MGDRLSFVKELRGPHSTWRIVRDEQTGNHYGLSNNGTGTLAFRCNAEGDVLDWTEVAGAMHGGQTHNEVQAELERRLVDGSSAREG